jgi:hypothetical protein
MSDLTFAEKQKFEQVFGMGSGYVLNFTNRTFEEFIRESTGRNIYDSRYDNASGSKAHRLRMFWQKEDNKLVGKLLTDMLDYLGETNPKTEICRLIVARLLGHQTQAPLDQPAPQIPVAKALAGLKEEFDRLAAEKDRKGQSYLATDDCLVTLNAVNVPRAHHYLPVFYLKGFASPLCRALVGIRES